MQQRNIGNEVLAAIAVMGVIAVAIAFGVLVTLPSSSTRPDSNGQVIDELTITPTELIVSALPSDTPQTPTITPVSPTATNTLTLTAAGGGIATVVFTASPTRTTIPTLTHTPSPVLPTSTLTPSVVPASATPTRTATSTRTLSPVPPTATLTPTFTASPPDHTPTPEPCTRPDGWVTYTVQRGDTLFLIGLAVRSNVTELSRVNCLRNVDRIMAGDRLFVPRFPTTPPAEILPTPLMQGRSGCTAPQIAMLTSPRSGATLSGRVSVQGTAYLPDEFGFYKLEVRPDFATTYNFWSEGRAPVVNGELGMLDTSVFGAGLHWLRLVVVSQDGATPPEQLCTIPLHFR